MSTLEITLAVIEAYESDADRHDREGRHRIASVYRAAAHRKRLEMREPLVFGEPSDTEFIPIDHNDADGVQTMRDCQ